MFTGSMVALVTPMHEDGSVDYPALEKLVEFHIENQTDVIVSVGTSGESPTLSHDEHIDVVKHTLLFANGRVPVIAGTGSNNTKEAIALTERAKNAGAAAALLVVPYYNRPEQHGLYLHFKAIAEAVAIPQMLYNVPHRTGRNMENATVVELAKISNIIGIKDATGDVDTGAQLIKDTSDDFVVVSGDDATTLDLIKVGAKGCVSVTANVAPQAMHDLCQAGLAGDFKAAEAINQKLIPLHKDLFIQASPAPSKYILTKLGLIGEAIRLPLTPLNEEHYTAVDDAMAQAGIIPTN